MTALRMALTELRRLASGRLPRIALIAMAVIPTLYGGLYLYANHDPYASLDQVPTALVVNDKGATEADGTRVNAGHEVADQLIEDGAFDWHRVDESRARSGVRQGRYDFALVIPKGFSTSLTSATHLKPRTARMRMVTNDANSYLSSTIADRVTDNVRDALAQRVSQEAANSFLLGISQIRGQLVDAAHGADRLVDGAERAHRATGKLAAGAAKLDTGAHRLASGLATIQRRTQSLPSQTRKLADGAARVANGNRRIADAGDRVARVSTALHHDYRQRRADLVETMDRLGLDPAQRRQLLAVFDRLGEPVRRADAKVQQTHRELDRLATGAQRVASGNRALADAVPELVSGIARAHSGATRLSDGADRLHSGATRLEDGTAKLHRGATRLAHGLHQGVEKVPDVDRQTRRRLARTIADPVAVQNASQSSAGSYGAGLAPFFMSLAAWIGGYVLFLLVRPLSRRALAANQTPLRVALAGWLTPALLGAVQMALLLGVILLALGLVPAEVGGTLGFLVLMSASFIAIVHCLNAWLGPAGQFLGLVLMVLQLVSCGGTFPWQTIPQPLHPLHDVLPMGYAVDGLRQLMYGGMSDLVARDALVLAGWLVAALALTAVAARRQRVWRMKRVKPELSL